MNDALILDTNAVIGLLGGNMEIARIMVRYNRIIISAITCGEMDAGTQGTTQREQAAKAAFDELLSMPTVFVSPVSRRTGAFYATVYCFLKTRGTPIPTNDMWIAATALETGSVLCTGDNHLLSLPLIRTLKV